MAKLKRHHFFYGAILDALCQYNPDASPVLMSKGEESRQIYRVMTNTSQECILFFKYASPKTDGKNEDNISFLFTFSDDDKQKLKTFNEQEQCPIFLYLLCKQSNLKDSEIAVLKYDEYLNVEENRAVTIRIEKHKNSYLLFRKGNKSRENALLIPRNRIEKTFDQLLEDSLKEMPHRKVNQQHTFESLFNIETIYHDTSICPICNGTLHQLHINNGSDSMNARICTVCKRKYVNKKQYKIISKYCQNRPMTELYIMNFTDGDIPPCIKSNAVEGKMSVIEKEKSHLHDTNTDIIFIVPEETNICPIHNCKMDIKVMSFGIKYKDTVHFCRQCNKHIVSDKQAASLKNNLNLNRSRAISKINFLNLQ